MPSDQVGGNDSGGKILHFDINPSDDLDGIVGSEGSVVDQSPGHYNNGSNYTEQIPSGLSGKVILGVFIGTQDPETGTLIDLRPDDSGRLVAVRRTEEVSTFTGDSLYKIAKENRKAGIPPFDQGNVVIYNPKNSFTDLFKGQGIYHPHLEEVGKFLEHLPGKIVVNFPKSGKMILAVDGNYGNKVSEAVFGR